MDPLYGEKMPHRHAGGSSSIYVLGYVEGDERFSSERYRVKYRIGRRNEKNKSQSWSYIE